MEEPKTIKGQQISEVFSQFQKSHNICIVSIVVDGKWRTAEAKLGKLADEKFDINIKKDVLGITNFVKEMPVFINFQIEHLKYMFETTVLGIDESSEIVHLAAPEKMDCIARRNFVRVSLPKDLKVQVHFWHRGYNCENNDLIMPESTLWQASLLNISLGGLLMVLDCKGKCDFSAGQVVGLQFTPLPYEKPILLEGLIRHIQHNRQTGKTFLGIEFLGLQTSWQGKENFKSLSKVVKKYTTKN